MASNSPIIKDHSEIATVVRKRVSAVSRQIRTYGGIDNYNAYGVGSQRKFKRIVTMEAIRVQIQAKKICLSSQLRLILVFWFGVGLTY